MHIAQDKLAFARVLVVGDAMLDRYWYGAVDRISPEAPVPVVRVTRVEDQFFKTLGNKSNLQVPECVEEEGEYVSNVIVWNCSQISVELYLADDYYSGQDRTAHIADQYSSSGHADKTREGSVH